MCYIYDMAAVTFDTLKFARRLKDAGVPPMQAEAEASALAEALGDVDIATKRDLKELELRITGELTLLKWMVGAAVGGIAAILLKLFFPS